MPHSANPRAGARKAFKEAVLKCKNCVRWFKNRSGLTQHKNRAHPIIEPQRAEDNVALDGAEENYDVNADVQIDDDVDRNDESGYMEFDDIDQLENHEDYYGNQSTLHRDPSSDSSNARSEGESRRDTDEEMLRDTMSPEIIAQPKEREFHPVMTGWRCNKAGEFIPSDTPPPDVPVSAGDWFPYRNLTEFRVADFMFRQNEMPQGQVDELMDMWGAGNPDAQPPFANHQDLFETIDATRDGNVSWERFTVSYDGPLPEDGEPPSWMIQEYEVCFRNAKEVVGNMLSNRDYEGEFDYVPFKDYDAQGQRKYKDLLLGDWAWRQADHIAADKDIDSKGSTIVPIILGSDKTTVSIATGQNEYYPLYISIGGVRNNVRRAHRGAVAVLAFLANVKSERSYAEKDNFKHFRRQLFHSSLSVILDSLKDGMTKYEVMQCPDGHYRRIIFELGPYIADYPEQVLVGCVLQGWCARCLSNPENLDKPAGQRTRAHTELVSELFTKLKLGASYGIIKEIVPFTNDFPRADIHELMAPDLLHQIIKGVFKDYFVKWVEGILIILNGEREAHRIMDDIDHRIALVPFFAGLRRFPQGRGFKQWTGDDSKALMKVYLPALVGHLPDEVILTLRALLDFCYLVRRSVITEKVLHEISDALTRYYNNREIFQVTGVRKHFQVPRLHSVVHYTKLIREFGAPNGLCSSITESKHIEAVKKPWRRSNRYNALSQMLKTISRLDKLRASHLSFQSRGMLQNIFVADAEAGGQIPTTKGQDQEDDEIDDGPVVPGFVSLATTPQRGYPRDLQGLAEHTHFPTLVFLARKFLFRQTRPEQRRNIPEDFLNDFNPRVSVLHAAIALFHAPSDPSGVSGMRREYIRAIPSWRKGSPRYDTVFVKIDPDKPGMRGVRVARVFLFFSFCVDEIEYQCALVNWFFTTNNDPDELTGMWIVSPGYIDEGLSLSVIHVNTILRAAHLIPCYGDNFVADTHDIDPSQSLDNFTSFYVNKYVDHHANEIAF